MLTRSMCIDSGSTSEEVFSCLGTGPVIVTFPGSDFYHKSGTQNR